MLSNVRLYFKVEYCIDFEREKIYKWHKFFSGEKIMNVKPLYIAIPTILFYFLCAFLTFLTTFCGAYQYELSICAIFQNEARFMKEWIDYHRHVGVEHFWLYNNNSNDEYAEVLYPYIIEGCVELTQWPSQQNENDWYHYSFEVQTGAYNDAIAKAKGKSHWLAIIDLDEFIVPMEYQKSISAVLNKDFKGVSGLCVNWQHFGTSDIHSLSNKDSMLEKLTYRMEENHERNKLYKSIVKPHHVLKCVNPHYCLYLDNHWHVNPKYERFDMQNTGVYIDKIRLHHYWTRDIWYLCNVKIPRYAKWGVDKESVMKIADEMNKVYDRTILDVTGFKYKP